MFHSSEMSIPKTVTWHFPHWMLSPHVFLFQLWPLQSTSDKESLNFHLKKKKKHSETFCENGAKKFTNKPSFFKDG